MTIGVLTFHASLNYGSYWQARCLVEGLRARGHQAVLLDHRCRQVASAELRNAFQPELPARTPRRHHAALGRKVRAFAHAIERLPRSPAFPLDAPHEAGAFDTVVVGSDEVWNFSHPWYAARPLFFGEALRRRRLVAYAASFGSHPSARGVDPGWAARLDAFDAISVRDENSRALIAASLGRDPALVLDPCLQFPAALPAAPQDDGGYALLYGHGVPGWLAGAARAWADARGVRLISVGYPHPLADEDRADAGPIEYAALVAGARAMVTTFFHGAVFALHYARPFVAAASPYRRLKLEGLTAALGAGHRLVDERAGDAGVAALLDRPLEDGVRARIAAGRASSAAYLDRALA